MNLRKIQLISFRENVRNAPIIINALFANIFISNWMLAIHNFEIFFYAHTRLLFGKKNQQFAHTIFFSIALWVKRMRVYCRIDPNVARGRMKTSTESMKFWRTSDADSWLAHWFYTFDLRLARIPSISTRYQTHVRRRETMSQCSRRTANHRWFSTDCELWREFNTYKC